MKHTMIMLFWLVFAALDAPAQSQGPNLSDYAGHSNQRLLLTEDGPTWLCDQPQRPAHRPICSETAVLTDERNGRGTQWSGLMMAAATCR
jgi:hypothetical protein